ncbi:hypothetical protein AGLY_003699, partial [Aphis glycines]
SHKILIKHHRLPNEGNRLVNVPTTTKVENVQIDVSFSLNDKASSRHKQMNYENMIFNVQKLIDYDTSQIFLININTKQKYLKFLFVIIKHHKSCPIYIYNFQYYKIISRSSGYRLLYIRCCVDHYYNIIIGVLNLNPMIDIIYFDSAKKKLSIFIKKKTKQIRIFKMPINSIIMLFEEKLMENLVLNFLILDLNTNNFMIFQLQNYKLIFAILIYFKLETYTSCLNRFFFVYHLILGYSGHSNIYHLIHNPVENILP